MTAESGNQVLLIGYGNALRRDDGVGPCVARMLAERYPHRVHACEVHQLTPELSATLARYGTVIFIDAAMGPEQTEGRLVPVTRESRAPWGTHLASPAGLLALAEEIYGARPRAWYLAVAGEEFDLGEGLSERARDNARRAVVVLEEFLRSHFATGSR
jgi:hydrogenase maturation protease